MVYKITVSHATASGEGRQSKRSREMKHFGGGQILLRMLCTVCFPSCLVHRNMPCYIFLVSLALPFPVLFSAACIGHFRHTIDTI